MRGDSMKLLQAMFSETPETLNAVDVARASGELIATMINPIVFRVADINQAVITAPPVRMDDDINRDSAANNRLQSSLFAVRHGLRIDAPVTLQETEDWGLARSASPALATHPACAEVAFVNFDLATRQRRSALTLLGNPLPDFEKDHGDALARQASQLCGVGGTKIQRKEAHQLAKFTLRNMSMPVIPVLLLHVSSLALAI